MREVFSGLLGNTATKKRIGTAIENGHLPHALLIDGGKGSGKRTLALEISAALNCRERKNANEPLPCHKCPSCRKILGGGHVDIHIIGKRDGKATIGVDEVKELRSDMFLSSTEADFKVYIIEDAEAMTIEAQNSLLIVLEEPPRNVVIMLLASGTDRILTTIKSRAQYIAMSRFSPDEISAYLRAKDADAERIAKSDPNGFALAMRAADGRIGLALELILPKERESLYEERETALSVLRALRRGAPFTELYSAVMALPQKRQELSLALEKIMAALADLIALNYDANAPLLFFISRPDAEAMLDSIAPSRLFKLYDTVISVHDANSKNANINALLASLSSGLREA